MIKKFWLGLFAIISAGFYFLFGKFSWTTPPWANLLCEKARTKPKAFWTTSLGLLIVIALSIFAYHWYQSLPKPEQIIAQIMRPKITPNDKELIPDNLVIDFGVIVNDQFNSRSVAPINLIGKEVSQGITISPNIAGKWTWDSDSRLLFTPEKDWPADETYNIHFAKNSFAHDIKMKSFDYSFSTLPFVAKINDLTFYQDPVNAQLRQAVATISFNYPVNAASLDNHILLQYQALAAATQSFKYTLSYDENHRVAYLHSEAISLPSHEKFLQLSLKKGIKAISGPGTTQETVNAKVLIPDANSYFKIKNISSTIVRNQQDRPQQILAIETSLGVTTQELNHFLHVYLLPRDYPKTASEEAKLNYHWQDPGEVTDNILALAKPVNLQAIPADRDYADLHSFIYNAATPAYLYLKLDKGMHGFGDFALTQNYVAIVKVPEYPREITFLHKGSLLALGTEEKLSVLVRGLNAVKFDFARVLPDDINHLITQTSGNFSDPNFINPSFDQQNISEIFSQIQNFDMTDPGKEQYTALDLNKYVALNANGHAPLGLFLLQAHGWDPSKKIALNVATKRLVLITDLGIIVKDNNDATHDVFVQSITHGTPVNGATVDVLGKNGLAIMTRVTDQNGHVIFPALNDFTNEREPTVYLIHNGNDLSFIPYNRSDRLLNYSRFDVAGISSNPQYQAALTAYLFSDRGIYRPGDTAHIAMIIKQPFVFPQPPGLPLEITITDPRGVTVKDEKITLNDSGYMTFDFSVNATAATGQYLVNLYIVKDHHQSGEIGSTSIHVAEFLPDRMRISSHLSTEQTIGWISPNNLSAKVSLWNLYGAPAKDHRVSAKILLSPQVITFKEFPDYTFIDPLFDPKSPPKIFTDTLTDTRTNATGQAEFNLKLDRFFKATYKLTVFTEGFERDSGRSVTTQTSALISPLDYLVGYKPDSDLQYIKQNDVRKVHFIAINPQLKLQALNNLQLQLYSQHSVTTLVKKPDGTYQYQSLLQSTQISSQAFSITATGNDFTLTTKNIGDFAVAIVDANGEELSRFKYSVVGNSQQPLPKNAELNVKLNKTEFSPGEDIEMQITAPYIGAGLITIERDKVYAYQWFKTETTSSVQKIHLPADFQGGGYVNIAFVRDLNSPEIFMSPLSFSVLPFSVTHQEHDIKVTISTPDLARPGDNFPITYQTDKPSKIIVFAVDEGILQVSKYHTPDPSKFFFAKHALEVSTMQIVDQILPKFVADRELSAVGGDNGEAALYKNLNPFKRKTEAPVVYWSGIIDADNTPRQVHYQIPDYFNGTLRTMAIAVASNAVGTTDKTAEIRGHFVINPNVPTFVAPGDQFDVTASVANNVVGSGKNAAINIELKSDPAITVIGATKQTIIIPENDERVVHFTLRATAQLGSSNLHFVAQLNDKTSTMSSALSVRPATPFFTSITSGFTDQTKTLTLDRKLFPEYREVAVMASPSPLILVVGLQRYLNEYPYGCVEQVVSKAFPLLAMANQSWFINDSKNIEDKIQTTIQVLSQRQMSSGGFNYWPDTGTNESNDFASIYAMHFLTEAKLQGHPVPSDVFSAGIGYLRDYVTQDISDLDSARLHAYAIYILTRNEIVTTNYLTQLQLFLDQHNDYNWHQDISSVYIAATYQLLKNTAEANHMIHYYQPLIKQENVSTDFYNEQIANAQYVNILARHFPDRLKSLDHAVIMSLVNSLNNDAISTVLSSYTSLALAAYGQSYPLPANSFITINETRNNHTENTLSSANGLYQKGVVDLDAQNITFTNREKSPYFYQLIESGFDLNLPKQVNNQGIEVYREYHDINDKPLTTVKLGDEIIVHLRVRAIDNNYYDNVAIVDLLPGGFSIMRDTVNSQNNSQNINIDYADIREDRVIFFTSVAPDSKEIIYRIKATNQGNYIVPPIFAKAMYHPLVQSLGIASKISIGDTNTK